MIRIIFYAVLFYVFYKVVTSVLKMFSAATKKNENEPNPVQQKETTKKRLNIEQKDIVEASFEEIKDDKKEQAQ